MNPDSEFKANKFGSHRSETSSRSWAAAALLLCFLVACKREGPARVSAESFIVVSGTLSNDHAKQSIVRFSVDLDGEAKTVGPFAPASTQDFSIRFAHGQRGPHLVRVTILEQIGEQEDYSLHGVATLYTPSGPTGPDVMVSRATLIPPYDQGTLKTGESIGCAFTL